jgi:hypothetical protein
MKMSYEELVPPGYIDEDRRGQSAPLGNNNLEHILVSVE